MLCTSCGEVVISFVRASHREESTCLSCTLRNAAQDRAAIKENLNEARERLEIAEEELLGEKSRLDVLSRNLAQAREREVSHSHPLLLSLTTSFHLFFI